MTMLFCQKFNYSKEIITIGEQRAYVIAKKLYV